MTGGCAKYLCWFCCACTVIALFLVNLRPAPEARWAAAVKTARTATRHELAMPERRSSYREDVPLGRELQNTLHTACGEYGVPVELALAVMETESGFYVDAVGVDGHDIGLYQIRTSNHAWLQGETGADPLTAEGNIKCGVWFLGYLYDYAGSWPAALTCWRWGPGHGETSEYANAVLAAAEQWEAIP